MAGAPRHGPHVGGVQVVHREIEMHLLLHGGMRPRRSYEARRSLKCDRRAAVGWVEGHEVIVPLGDRPLEQIPIERRQCGRLRAVGSSRCRNGGWQSRPS